MNDLDDLKVYLINKYLNVDYSHNDLIVKMVNSEKFEYFYINNIMFRSIEKAIALYKPLLIIGCRKEKEVLLKSYLEVLKDWNENEKKYNDSDTDNFIIDYNIDLKEIDNIVLKMVSNSFSNTEAEEEILRKVA